MPSSNIVLVIAVIALFGLTAGLIIVHIMRVHLAARRWDRRAVIEVRRGRCPCCGAPLPAEPATNFPDCDNWIKRYRDRAKSEPKAKVLAD